MSNQLSLHEEQMALTRERILRALAAEILDRGVRSVTVGSVAERAGVAHRTVYRHYPTREALFEGFSNWVENHYDSPETGVPDSMYALSECARRVFRLFDADPEITAAWAHLRPSGIASRGRDARDAAFLDLARREGSDLEEPFQRGLGAILRILGSSETWARAREEAGLDGDVSGQVVAWLIDLAGRGLAAGEVPEHWKR